MSGLREAFIRRGLKAGARLVYDPDVRERLRREREQVRQRAEFAELDRWLERHDPDRRDW